MKKQDIKNTIEEGFQRLYKLDHLSLENYREDMFQRELKGEKRHRQGKPASITEKPKASAATAAKFFVVKCVVEALADNSVKPSDILHCRKASLIAKGLVEWYRETIEECLEGFDFEKFSKINYAEHLCG
jgi:hypothetical protein